MGAALWPALCHTHSRHPHPPPCCSATGALFSYGGGPAALGARIFLAPSPAHPCAPPAGAPSDQRARPAQRAHPLRPACSPANIRGLAFGSLWAFGPVLAPAHMLRAGWPSHPVSRRATLCSPPLGGPLGRCMLRPSAACRHPWVWHKAGQSAGRCARTGATPRTAPVRSAKKKTNPVLSRAPQTVAAPRKKREETSQPPTSHRPNPLRKKSAEGKQPTR